MSLFKEPFFDLSAWETLTFHAAIVHHVWPGVRASDVSADNMHTVFADRDTCTTHLLGYSLGCLPKADMPAHADNVSVISMTWGSELDEAWE